jgi:hypothetical protein
MQARQLLEVGALVALNGPIFAQAQRAYVPPGAIARYWAVSKCRLERWKRSLQPYPPDSPLANRNVPRVRAVVEEILVSELLTRTWAAATAAYDKARRCDEVYPVAHTVFLSHQEARNAALRWMVGPSVDVEEAVELNRLRRRLERWGDVLLAYLQPFVDVSPLAFEAERVEDFAADLPVAGMASGMSLAWQLMFASMRSSFQSFDDLTIPNGDLNRAIASSVLGCLSDELFDATGLAKSLWIERIGRVADDTQGMIDELLELDALAAPIEVTAFRRG